MTKPTLGLAKANAKSVINLFEKLKGRKATPEEIKSVEDRYKTTSTEEKKTSN
jgi:hypothetical protein